MQTQVDEDDMGAIFRARKIASQERRAGNRENSLAMLQALGLQIVTHNGGVHLIVEGAWDFWPGTGRFIERKGKPGGRKRQGRGVHNLARYIKEDCDAAAL